MNTMIKALKNKATGWDSLPAEFFKTFIEDLSDPLLTTCYNILTTGEIPQSWSEAHIIVFAKLGKDPCKVPSDFIT